MYTERSSGGSTTFTTLPQVDIKSVQAFVQAHALKQSYYIKYNFRVFI